MLANCVRVDSCWELGVNWNSCVFAAYNKCLHIEGVSRSLKGDKRY